MKSARPRFYFSFRSPYAWLAARVLRARAPGVLSRLERLPYWEPDEATATRLSALGGRVAYVPMSRPKHLYILQDVKRLARALGLDHVWPVDERPAWDVPHLAYLAAERRGRADDFLWACLRARWEQGRDICRRETMSALERELELPQGTLAGAVLDSELLDAGARVLLRAWSDGVFGIPFFVCGADKFWGVDRLDAFLSALAARERAAAGRAPEPALTAAMPAALLSAEGTWDEDHPGGCG